MEAWPGPWLCGIHEGKLSTKLWVSRLCSNVQGRVLWSWCMGWPFDKVWCKVSFCKGFIYCLWHWDTQSALISELWIVCFFSISFAGRLKSGQWLPYVFLFIQIVEWLRVHSFGVIWIKISDLRLAWIMLHQRNCWIHDQSGFIGSFEAPWSRQILDHWSWSRSSQWNAALDCTQYLLVKKKLSAQQSQASFCIQ